VPSVAYAQATDAPAASQAAPQQAEVTIRTEVVTGTGSSRVFVGPVSVDLTFRPILRDPITGDPFINEVNKTVTCGDLVAGTDVVIFNCLLRKNIKYKAATALQTVEITGPGIENGIVGDVSYATVWIPLAGAADVTGARPGDTVHLESFTVNQSLNVSNCIIPVGTKLNVGCNTLLEKDDVLLAFKTTRIQQVTLTTDP
ncbi:MAG TPA: hypothetical protein VIL11_03545, partial [Limnochordales bacterium]